MVVAIDQTALKDQERDRVERFYPGIVLALCFAAALLTAYIALDHVLFPEVAGTLLAMRLAFIASLIPMALTARTSFARRHPYGVALVGTAIMGGMIDLMVMQTGGATSPYYAGNNLVLLGVATLLPWGPRWTLMASLILVGMYAVAAWPRDASEVPPFINALTFTSSMGLVAVVSSAIADNMRSKEIKLRRDRERMARAKDEFLASVSHDLRTPLNVVMGYAELLADSVFGPVNEEQKDTLQRMMDSARGQLVLVDDLLDLARIEQGKVTCDLGPVCLHTMVPFATDMMEILLAGKPVSFGSNIDRGLVVVADRERLKQVLVNILTNAAKFTEEGVVRMFAEQRDGSIEISIADSGPGMDESVLQSVLDPFEKGNKSATGWGLGLSIVVKLIDLMNGSLAIDSKSGRGTTVTVRLPAHSSSAEPKDRDGDQPPVTSSQRPSASAA